MVKIDGGRKSIDSLNMRLCKWIPITAATRAEASGGEEFRDMKMKTKSEEEKIEIMQQATKQLIESLGEKSSPTRSSSLLESYAAVDGEDDRITDDRRRHLLSRLLCQLETLEGDQDHSADVGKAHPSEKSEAGSCASNEELAKELEAVKKQNFVTHCLLSALIVLTLACIVAWMFRRGANGNHVQEAMNHVHREWPERGSFPGLKIPGPIEDLLGMDSSEEAE